MSTVHPTNTVCDGCGREITSKLLSDVFNGDPSLGDRIRLTFVLQFRTLSRLMNESFHVNFAK